VSKKRFSLYVVDADGPIQLRLMDNEEGHGMRLLGAKGDPEVEIVKQWDLSWDELDSLIQEMKKIRGTPFKPVRKP
jgi:hypothetical protein